MQQTKRYTKANNVAYGLNNAKLPQRRKKQALTQKERHICRK